MEQWKLEALSPFAVVSPSRSKISTDFVFSGGKTRGWGEGRKRGGGVGGATSYAHGDNLRDGDAADVPRALRSMLRAGCQGRLSDSVLAVPLGNWL